MSQYTAPFHFQKLYLKAKAILDQTNTMQLANDLPAYLTLIQQLLDIHNNPIDRHGKEKIEFIQQHLAKANIASKIHKLPNLDSSKTANEDNSWYVLEAVLGNPASSNNVLVTVHHDTISKKTERLTFFESESPTYSLAHSWLLDVTVQLAAVLYAFAKLNQEVSFESASLTLLITDGEEVNTLGMRAWLEYKQTQEVKRPYDFVLACEPTGRGQSGYLYSKHQLYQGEIPRIATANRGKATGIVTATVPKETSVVDTFISFSHQFRGIQKKLYLDSINNVDSSYEQLLPTAISFTIGKFTHENAFVFFEVRSNEKIDATESMKLLKNATHKLVESPNITVKELADMYHVVNLNLDAFSLLTTDNTYTLKVRNGKNIHPGNYNPFHRENAQIALELILCVLTFDEKAAITKIDFGRPDKPNSVPPNASIQFSIKPDLDSIRQRLSKSQSNWTTLVEQLYATKKKTGIVWEVLEDPYIPAREVVKLNDSHNHLLENAQHALKEALTSVFKLPDIEVTQGVFNAMTDIGPATYLHNEWFWPKDLQGNTLRPVLTVGVGNFEKLHTEFESLSANELIISMVQYESILKYYFKHA